MMTSDAHQRDRLRFAVKVLGIGGASKGASRREKEIFMALQSQLFRNDPKLEAAAVSDPAHIVPGARGEHVRKIQLALIQLDRAAIAADGVYGPATAAAVLAYKKKRNI